MTDLDSRLVLRAPNLTPTPLSLSGLAGVRASGVAAGIKASGSLDVALIVFDEAATCAGLFTQNRLAAAPVALSRQHLAETGGRVRAIVVNSGNANACTGQRGSDDATAMAGETARLVGCPVAEVLVASTGVIGHHLPLPNVLRGIRHAFEQLTHDDAGGRAFRDAIQTTDAFPKEVSAEVDGARVAGVCKGAGMIHPNMATMLAFVGTDAFFDAPRLASVIRQVATTSFNAVHVDTHPSTNDTFLLFATGKSGHHGGAPVVEAIGRAAQRLAWLIARDGEGATKVTTLVVRGAESDAAARAIADRIAGSALVRTAIFGNDPNWGRIVSQVGNCPEVKGIEALRCTLQGIVVYENAAPTEFDRHEATRAMAAEDVRVELELKDGNGEAMLMTSDLGYRYIQVNAEYTT